MVMYMEMLLKCKRSFNIFVIFIISCGIVQVSLVLQLLLSMLSQKEMHSYNYASEPNTFHAHI
jgi:hypothetical protein